MLPYFQSIFDMIKAFPDEQTCIDYLEKRRWDGNVISPFDSESKVYKCKGNKYKCKNSGKYFNVKTATVFEDTKIPLQKWFMALYVFSCHKKGISSHQLAKDITVTQKTAWFLLHRLRYIFDTPNFQTEMEGIVELDETYIGGKEGNKHGDKKTEGTQGRSVKTKSPVFGMKQREGHVQAIVVSDVKRPNLYPVIYSNIKCGASVYTDELRVYRGLHGYYAHSYISHSAKQYVDGMVHTNGLENFWSHLKRGINGINHWVSAKHLQRYVNEYTLRYNSRKFDTQSRFDLVLENMEGRLTYKKLIA